jgi:hypothetical protein
MSEAPKTPFDELDPHDVLTPAQVAQRVHIDARSIRRAISRGQLAASRVAGLRVLIRTSTGKVRPTQRAYVAARKRETDWGRPE